MKTKRGIYTALGCLVILTGCYEKEDKEENNTFTPEEKKTLSEMIGYRLYNKAITMGLEPNLDSVILGFKKAKNKEESPISNEEFLDLITEANGEKGKAKSRESLRKAETFLKANAKNPKVTSLENGKLQYAILESGSGPTVNEHCTPEVIYESRFADGQEYDSSESTIHPTPLELDTLVPGLKMGVLGMKEGEKRRIFIHPDLGYGSGGRLPANSLLVFDVKVVKADSNEIN